MKLRNRRILLIVSLMLFIVVLIAFLSVFTRYCLSNFTELKSWEIYASGNLTSEVGGFDLNGTALTFGKVRTNGTSTRTIDFENSYAFPVMVKISSEGEISKFLSYEPEIFVEQNATKSIGISFLGLERYPLGYYDGYVKFRVLRVD